MSKIREVALAICRSSVPTYSRCVCFEDGRHPVDGGTRCINALREARGAIGAMKNPTETMIAAMRSVPTAGACDLQFDDYHTEEWNAGVDAALSENL